MNIKIFLFVIVFFILSIIIWFAFSESKSQISRPSNLSNNFSWIGGQDGGEWISLICKDKKIYAEIYSQGGILCIKGFVLSDRNCVDIINKYTLVGFDGQALLFKDNINRKYYRYVFQ